MMKNPQQLIACAFWFCVAGIFFGYGGYVLAEYQCAAIVAGLE